MSVYCGIVKDWDSENGETTYLANYIVSNPEDSARCAYAELHAELEQIREQEDDTREFDIDTMSIDEKEKETPFGDRMGVRFQYSSPDRSITITSIRFDSLEQVRGIQIALNLKNEFPQEMLNEIKRQEAEVKPIYVLATRYSKPGEDHGSTPEWKVAGITNNPASAISGIQLSMLHAVRQYNYEEAERNKIGKTSFEIEEYPYAIRDTGKFVSFSLPGELVEKMEGEFEGKVMIFHNMDQVKGYIAGVETEKGFQISDPYLEKTNNRGPGF